MNDPMPEIWLPVAGWEGLYEVSSEGQVRSLPRMTSTGLRGGVILKPSVDEAGRRSVHLSKDGTQKARRIHQLVAEAFIGPRPKGQETRHLDDNPANNRVSNLAYGTNHDNKMDMLRNGRHYWANQTHCINGHEFTPENTYWRAARSKDQAPSRVCKTCVSDRVREHFARRGDSGPPCRNGCEATARARGLCSTCYHREWAAERRSDDLLECVCPQCGITFQFLPGKGSGNRKYCSDECFRKARAARQRECARQKRKRA